MIKGAKRPPVEVGRSNDIIGEIVRDAVKTTLKNDAEFTIIEINGEPCLYIDLKKEKENE